MVLNLGFTWNMIFLSLAFVSGLLLGSFMNCVAWRIAHGESFVRGRSRCTTCGHTLSPLELIPLLSYFLQGGKSRCCGEKISKRYPFTEFVTGLVFAAIVWRCGVTLTSAKFLVLAILLMGLTLVDLETGIIPDGFILAGILNFVLFTVLGGEKVFSALVTGLLGGLSIGVPILLLSVLMDRVLKKESMGGGDIKLYFVLGLYFSIPCNIFMVLLSCIFGIGFTLIFQHITVGDAENPTAFPFGPSIAAAAVASIFIAEPIIAFYMGLF